MKPKGPLVTATPRADPSVGLDGRTASARGREGRRRRERVVVVGAGLAGLAAAYELRDHRPLILERELRPGGRVLSLKNPFATLDLGACFAVGPHVFPEPKDATIPATRLRERGPIWLVCGGRLISGGTPSDCLDQLECSEEARAALGSFVDGRLNADALPEPQRRLVDAFFKQIHPADVRQYVPERQRDALRVFYPDHYPQGNGCAVDAYVSALGDSTWLGCTATSVEEDENCVLVRATTIHRGRRESVELRADIAVVATTADVARRIVRTKNSACSDFLAHVEYGTYTTVGLVLDAAVLPRFRYIVSPDNPLNVVIQQAGEDPRYRALLCYYSDPCAAAMAALSDGELIDRTLGHLSELHCGSGASEALRFAAVKRWPAVGTILSPAYAASKGPAARHAADRIILAGDYVSRDSGWGYGTADAVASGRAAAGIAKTRFGRQEACA